MGQSVIYYDIKANGFRWLFACAIFKSKLLLVAVGVVEVVLGCSWQICCCYCSRLVVLLLPPVAFVVVGVADPTYRDKSDLRFGFDCNPTW